MTAYHSQGIASDLMEVVLAWAKEKTLSPGIYLADVAIRGEFGGNAVRFTPCENRDAVLHLLQEEYYESEGWPACNDLIGGSEMSEVSNDYMVTRISLRLSGEGASIVVDQAEPLVLEDSGKVKVLSSSLRALRR